MWNLERLTIYQVYISGEGGVSARERGVSRGGRGRLHNQLDNQRKIVASFLVIRHLCANMVLSVRLINDTVHRSSCSLGLEKSELGIRVPRRSKSCI